MGKIVGLMVVLFVLLSLPAFAFVSDFEGEADTVFMFQRWSGVTFPYVDGWYARVDISDSEPAEVFNQAGEAYAYEGTHALAIVIFDNAVEDPGAIKWDFNSRPGEAGINHFADVVEGDTIRFHLWIPAKYEIDTQLVYRPYSQYIEWSVWDADSIGIDSIYDNEGLEEGGWRVFDVVLPDTVGGSDILAVGIQFEYPDTVNPDDIIYADYIYSTGAAGIPISTDPGVLSLPASSINNVSYEINDVALVHIAVYNSLGQKVKEIVPGLQAAGAYSLDIDLAPGIYICKVTAGKNGKSTKLLILE
jgi:hypothetical protein